MEALSIIEAVAKEHGNPLVEVGTTAPTIANCDGVILGISLSAQLVQNVEAREKGPLLPAVVEALDQAWQRAKGDAPTYWR